MGYEENDLKGYNAFQRHDTNAKPLHSEGK